MVKRMWVAESLAKVSVAVTVATGFALGLACRSAAPPPASGSPQPASAAAPVPEGSATAAAQYEGPKVSLMVRPVDGGSQATANVTFRTGGWELREDRTRVANDVGIAYLTFTGPGTDEMVTQALVSREWSWRSATSFSKAEVWVNVIRRGQPARDPEYRLAARYP
jgi:hypothetical protein